MKKRKKNKAKHSKQKSHVKHNGNALPKNRSAKRRWMIALGIASGIALAIAAMLGLFSHYKIAAIWFTWAGVVLAVTSLFVWFQTTVSAEEPRFSVAAEVLITVANREITSQYLLAYSHGEETVLSPITDLIYIRFTNRGTVPIMIDNYSAEVRAKKEPQWKQAASLNRIVTTGGKFFLANQKDGLAAAFETTLMEPLFDHAIKDKSIGAGEALRGWLLMERPEGLDGEANSRKWRIRVRDVNNNERMSEIAEAIGKGFNDSLTNVGLKLGDKRDLRQLRLMYYSDMWK